MNILYGIAGEGLGHATRSRPVIERLQKKHKVHILVSGNAYLFLKGRLKNVHEIDGMNIYYKDNCVRHIATFFYSLFKLPKMVLKNLFVVVKLLLKFVPDVVVTDFESLSWIVGKLLGRKVISIDNIHALTHLEIDEVHAGAGLFDSLVVLMKTPFCSKYFIPSFFHAEPRKGNVIVVPPILRKEVIKAVPEVKNHILVYQTSKSFREQLVKILSDFPKENFILYGFGAEPGQGNIHFEASSEKEFIEVLRSAKAVITNGGFTLITEALYLGKPVLSVPVKKHQEQNVNAHYIEKLGYGMCVSNLDCGALRKFLDGIPKYSASLKGYERFDNSLVLSLIDRAVK
jgi:uncharacterized protein (TIGR00661 family)